MSKMYKTILLTITIIIFSVFTNSKTFAGVDGSPFEGLYIGLTSVKNTFDASATYAQVDTPNTAIPGNPIRPSNFTAITSITSNDSYGGGIFAGYGLDYGMFYTSVEAAFIIDKGNSIISDGTRSIKLSKSNTLDLNLRGGATIADKALVFGLIGYSGASMKSKGIGELLGENDRFNKRITAFRYGGGIEVSIMENIAARLEYTRSSFSSALVIDGSDQFMIKPKTSRIMFSIVLHMY
jgi:opacity protein-like surface antigen